MLIRELKQNEEIPWTLLLAADPSRELVKKYVAQGDSFVAERDGEIVGVIVLLPITPMKQEIMNIAVAEDVQGQGIGKRLIEYVLKAAVKKNLQVVEVGTGNSSMAALSFYQKCGFRMDRIDHNYFVRNYDEKIEENGIWCRDMVRLVYEV
ncbi:GNAT family N-acetyltransferase [Alkalicoccobacillus murimartini]|uniref:Ribosomal protein S18 acetylase RimI-like enzyme n=1 Tax=Alkalicoccobacillus murimartini TaxID=171685 RepID=A0ABT9YIQ9_9BACI|nr:GNAT family N-acetyltransferase [Alkalicoccobacillus murimartini]MDQ0207596.1 ribosomal protein S18 acetylase RimI-like enzyme [Alkalicoccobacillus murimartini]